MTTVQQVNLWRAEGKIGECYGIIFASKDEQVRFDGQWNAEHNTIHAPPIRVVRTNDVEGDVLMHVFEWGKTAPEVGYDKTDFKVIWTNGFTYSGRFDMKKGGKGDFGGTFFESLIRSMRWVLSQENKPAFASYSEEVWQEHRKNMRNVLDEWLGPHGVHVV